MSKKEKDAEKYCEYCRYAVTVSLTDDMICEIVREIKSRYSDCAVTLSIGEKSEEAYRSFFEAGADRYLLRHETADSEHYSRLHPPNLTAQKRQECLYTLKKIGFQTGAGFMVGSPYQTNENLADDLELVAVITAAIHAYEEAQGNAVSGGLVVRSIRKRNVRWQNA